MGLCIATVTAPQLCPDNSIIPRWHTGRPPAGQTEARCSPLTGSRYHFSLFGSGSATTMNDCSHNFLPSCHTSNLNRPGTNSHSCSNM